MTAAASAASAGAWREACAAPPLWAELEFSRCALRYGWPRRVNAAVLKLMCRRAGAALRDLRLDAPACAGLTAVQVFDALRGGGCAGVRRIHTRPGLGSLSPEQAHELAAAFPLLERTTCTVESRGMPSLTEAFEAALPAALPGPLSLMYTISSRTCGTAPQLLPRSVTELSVDVVFCPGADAFVPPGLAALTEALHGNEALTGLHMNCGVGDAGTAVLAAALRSNATLRRLDVHGNNIGDAGCFALADALRCNATLAVLDLGRNKIGDDGAATLAGALRVNASLTVLNLHENCIRDAGAAALADALRVNSALKRLDVHYNKLGKDGIAVLTEAANGHATLRELFLMPHPTP